MIYKEFKKVKKFEELRYKKTNSIQMHLILIRNNKEKGSIKEDVDIM